MISILTIILIAFLTFSLGLVVFINSPKNYTSRIFLMMTFWIAIWQLSNFFENQTNDFIWSSILLRVDFASAAMVGCMWVIFCLNFPQVTNTKMTLIKIGVYFISLLLVFLSFTDLIINNFSIFSGVIRFSYGHLWILYASTITLFFAYGCIDLIYKSFKLKGIEKIQTIYVLLGFSISLTIALIINLFLTNIITLDYLRIGIYGMIFFIIFTAYAIIKHHLMNIKVIASELLSILLVGASFIEIFIFNSISELIIRIFIFLFSLVLAGLLVRSVLYEVKRREEIEKLNKELQKATADLRTANKELQRLDDAKSEFLSIASHQLRTPVTIIKGYASMIIEGSYGKVSKKIVGVLKNVTIANDRLLNLIENLLDISRIEAGRLEFDLKEIDLAGVVKPIVTDFQQKAKVKGLKLQFFENEKIPQIVADTKKIGEVISNIIDNSIKYTPKGEIIVSLHQEGTSVVFSCQDTGLGIEPDDLPRLFHKFVRGKDMMKIHTEGTGLGMYFARTVIENMGGRIWAESPGKNRGSKFCFSLPLADKKKAKKIKV